MVFISGLFIISLIGIRFFIPTGVVSESIGFIGGTAAGFIFTLALAQGKKVSFAQASPWRIVLGIGAILTGLLTDVILRFGFFSKGEATPGVVAFLFIAALLVPYGWWKLFNLSIESDRYTRDHLKR